MKKLLSILLPLLVAGCAKDDPATDNGGGSAPGHGKYIAVTANAAATRGTPVTSAAQIADFGLFCSHTGKNVWTAADAPGKVYDRKMVRGAAGLWEYAAGDPAEWEASTAADNYTFFACAPFATGEYDASANASGNGITVISAAADAGIPRLRYTVPARTESQPDLMIAAPRYDLHPTGHPVALTMRHALTAVGFRVSGSGEKITGIGLSGVWASGELAMDGDNIAWSNLSDGAPGGWSAPIAFDAGQDYFTAGAARNLLTGDGWLMMIPQPLNAAARVRMDFDDGTYREFGLDAFEWLAGERVVYNIRLSDAEESVAVSPEALTLPAAFQMPAAQTLAVTCTAGGGEADDMPWTLTSDAPWLTLSLTDYPGSAAGTLSGTGSRTVYLFAQRNGGTGARSATIYLGPAADNRPLCTVVQNGN